MYLEERVQCISWRIRPDAFTTMDNSDKGIRRRRIVRDIPDHVDEASFEALAESFPAPCRSADHPIRGSARKRWLVLPSTSKVTSIAVGVASVTSGYVETAQELSWSWAHPPLC